MATDLTGSAGPSGIYSVMRRDWLFQWGVESQALQEEMAEWTHWISNESPPYVAYHAFCTSQLVALDKNPGSIQWA